MAYEIITTKLGIHPLYTLNSLVFFHCYKFTHDVMFAQLHRTKDTFSPEIFHMSRQEKPVKFSPKMGQRCQLVKIN